MDLIITRSNEKIASIFSIYDPVISNHFTVHCNLSIQSPQNPAVTITHRKLRARNFDGLRQDIADSPLCLSDQPSLSINERCIQYHTLLASILEKHAPLKTKAIILRPHAPWYTDDIRVQKSRRRRLERRWRLSKLSVDRKVFVDQCKLVKNLVFNAKMNFNSTLISYAGSFLKRLTASSIESLRNFFLIASRQLSLQIGLPSFSWRKSTYLEMTFQWLTSPTTFTKLTIQF